ncbi:DMT family transporter [Cypionkella psychrotolerans]|uniref:DMT family transporter n=1 Tax=Cypionkella psychrotolerans TaxID=1678131 RepID=UPI0006B47A89|nr:DMT family transporter [Cypionkella psychrotolerans]
MSPIKVLPTAAATRKGILMLMLGVAMFSTMDAVAKGLLHSYPTAQVVWARFIGQVLLVLVILGPKRVGPTLRTPYPWLHLARSSFQLATTGLFFLSLGYIGLAEATALADMSPLLITLGAALFLGEKLGPRRIAGVAVAMIGALMIIRPGAGLFTPAALLPLACAVCYAASALLTRLVGQKEGPATSMLHAALFGAVATSIAVAFVWQPIALADLPRFAALGCLGTAAQFCLIRAFSMAEASAIAPFSYLGILYATLFGIAFYGEYPDTWTIIGALVIAGSGLYVWHRETIKR